MRIAFWSGDGQSGTTSNMLAVAAMVSIICPKARIRVQRLGQQMKSVSPKSTQDNKTDYIFLDCGRGTDVRKLRMLQKMDIVVVNLKAEKRAVQRFLGEDMHRFPRTMILLGDGYRRLGEDKLWLEHRYRVSPQRMGQIYHNEEFAQAFLKGKVRRFVLSEYKQRSNLRNEQLLIELEEFARKILIYSEKNIQEVM